jgi:hypothetical protein
MGQHDTRSFYMVLIGLVLALVASLFGKIVSLDTVIIGLVGSYVAGTAAIHGIGMYSSAIDPNTNTQQALNTVLGIKNELSKDVKNIEGSLSSAYNYLFTTIEGYIDGSDKTHTDDLQDGDE